MIYYNNPKTATIMKHIRILLLAVATLMAKTCYLWRVELFW